MQTFDCQVKLPASLPALTSAAPHQSQHRREARKQQEGKEGREDVHHVQLPDRSPADASSAVGAAGMHGQAGERAAMSGLISANHKETLEGFWNKGQLHSQAQTSGHYGVAFCYQGPEHDSLSWEAAGQDSAPEFI